MIAPYRIVTKVTPKVQGQGALPTEEAARNYLDRLTKLIPSEVVALYLFIRGLSPTHTETHTEAPFDLFVHNWFAVCCLAVVIVVRGAGSFDPGKGWRSIQVGSVIITSVSFFFWVYLLGDGFLGWYWSDSRIAVALTALWTVVCPYFYLGQVVNEGRGKEVDQG